ncbi:MAG TPA: hypothetical protein VD906_16150 [Caulobacteraceae bacterium]|nr:hypothetical protein [Caulobacteraceae bacterium]
MQKLLLALAALAFATPAAAQSPFAEAKCPDSVAAVARCYSARDAQGAYVWAAVPKAWNKRLVVHSHGGPRSGAGADDPVEDLTRFSAFVRAGYAWTGSTYRRGGYGVRMAAEDTDNSRKMFWTAFGRPERTLLHGQSWGGNIAAKAAELYALDTDGGRNYDGVLLTNGVLMGGTRAYQFRAGLRAVYQYYCKNHPAPDEAQYPLWQGLPKGAQMSRAELRRRVDACTGVEQPPEKRTPEQAQRLRDILTVTGVDEANLIGHLAWATNLFQDLVHERLGGLNPFDNSQVIYAGSSDDQALNAGVQRFTADPEALARLAYDADLSGLIVLPTVTLHALHDPVVSFEAEAQYAATIAAAGRSHLLVQTATDEDQHSKLSDSEYLAVLQALESWIDSGWRPTVADIAGRCAANLPAYGQGCHFVAAKP